MDESEERKTSAAEVWLFGFMAGVVILALLGFAYLIGYNHGKGQATTGDPVAEQPATQQTTTSGAPSGPGRELFVSTCGACHTLADADATGAGGPNLDQLKPDQARVLAAIANGGTGSGVMPEGLYTGKQAQEVAQYVSSVAGQ